MLSTMVRHPFPEQPRPLRKGLGLKPKSELADVGFNGGLKMFREKKHRSKSKWTYTPVGDPVRTVYLSENGRKMVRTGNYKTVSIANVYEQLMKKTGLAVILPAGQPGVRGALRAFSVDAMDFATVNCIRSLIKAKYDEFLFYSPEFPPEWGDLSHWKPNVMTRCSGFTNMRDMSKMVGSGGIDNAKELAPVLAGALMKRIGDPAASPYEVCLKGFINSGAKAVRIIKIADQYVITDHGKGIVLCDFCGCPSSMPDLKTPDQACYNCCNFLDCREVGPCIDEPRDDLPAENLIGGTSNLREQLLELNYLDGGLLTAHNEVIKRRQERDFITITQALARRQWNTAPVPSGLTSSDKAMLSRQYPNTSFVENTNFVDKTALFKAERKAIEVINSKMRLDDRLVRHVKLTKNNRIQHGGESNCIPQKCSCPELKGTVALMTIEDSTISMSDLMMWASAANLNGMWIAIPMLCGNPSAESGELSNSQGHWWRTDEIVYWALNNSTVVHKLSTSVVDCLMHYDGVNMGDQVVQISGRADRICYTRRLISMEKTLSQELVKSLRRICDKEPVVRLPIPTLITNFNSLSAASLRIEECTLSRALLEKMINRNLSDSCTMQELCGYSMGHSFERTVAANRVVFKPTQRAEVVLMHAYAAKLITVVRHINMSLMNFRDVNEETSSNIIRMLFSVMTATINEKNTNQLLGQSLDSVTKDIAYTVIDTLRRTEWLTVMDDYTSITEPFRVYNLQRELLHSHEAVCKHHKHDCKHAGENNCECCQELTDNPKYCDCCSPSEPCVHKCHHMCLNGDHSCGNSQCGHNPVICDCCGKSSCSNPCTWCLPTVQPTKKDSGNFISLDDLNTWHAHKCDNCGEWYKHKHNKPYKSELHPQDVTECCHCNPSKDQRPSKGVPLTAGKKLVTNRVGVKDYRPSTKTEIRKAVDTVIPTMTKKSESNVKPEDTVVASFIKKEQQRKEDVELRVTALKSLTVEQTEAKSNDAISEAIPKETELLQQQGDPWQVVVKTSKGTNQPITPERKIESIIAICGVEYMKMLHMGPSKAWEREQIIRPSHVDMPKYKSLIKFCRPGESTLDMTSIQLNDVMPIYNNDNHCGLLSIMKTYTHLSLSELREVLGHEESLMIEDFKKLAKYFRLNVAIVTMTNVVLFTYDDPWEGHACIMITDGRDGPNTHWQPVLITQTGPINGYNMARTGVDLDEVKRIYATLCGPNAFLNWENISEELKVEAEYQAIYPLIKLMREKPTLSCEPTVDSTSGKVVLSTRGAGGPATLETIPVPLEFSTIANILDTGPGMLFDADERMRVTETPMYDHVFTVLELVQKELIELMSQAYKLIQLSNGFISDSNSIKRKPKVLMIPAGNQRFLCNKFDDKIKTGDVIGIKTRKGITPGYVTTTPTHFYIYCPARLPEAPTVHCYKQSMSSIMRAVRPLMSTMLSNEKLRNLLNTAETFTFVPGGGKTSTLVEAALAEKSNKPLIVAKNRSAVEELSERLGPDYNVMSLEQGAMYKGKKKVIIIDEGNQCTLIDLIKLCSMETVQLYIAGDVNQIPVIDTGILPTNIIPTSILDNPALNPPQTSNTTYRFGGELLKEVARFTPSIKQGTEKNTSFSLIALNKLDTIELSTIISENEIDVVITFHKKILEMLRNDSHVINSLLRLGYNNPEQQIVTAHAFNSRSAARVLILQIAPGNADSGVHTDRRWVYSALTRATDRCVFVTVTSVNRGTHVIDYTASELSGGAPGDKRTDRFKSLPMNWISQTAMASTSGIGRLTSANIMPILGSPIMKELFKKKRFRDTIKTQKVEVKYARLDVEFARDYKLTSSNWFERLYSSCSRNLVITEQHDETNEERSDVILDLQKAEESIKKFDSSAKVKLYSTNKAYTVLLITTSRGKVEAKMAPITNEIIDIKNETFIPTAFVKSLLSYKLTRKMSSVVTETLSSNDREEQLHPFKVDNTIEKAAGLLYLSMHIQLESMWNNGNMKINVGDKQLNLHCDERPGRPTTLIFTYGSKIMWTTELPTPISLYIIHRCNLKEKEPEVIATIARLVKLDTELSTNVEVDYTSKMQLMTSREQVRLYYAYHLTKLLEAGSELLEVVKKMVMPNLTNADLENSFLPLDLYKSTIKEGSSVNCNDVTRLPMLSTMKVNNLPLMCEDGRLRSLDVKYKTIRVMNSDEIGKREAFSIYANSMCSPIAKEIVQEMYVRHSKIGAGEINDLLELDIETHKQNKSKLHHFLSNKAAIVEEEMRKVGKQPIYIPVCRGVDMDLLLDKSGMTCPKFSYGSVNDCADVADILEYAHHMDIQKEELVPGKITVVFSAMPSMLYANNDFKTACIKSENPATWADYAVNNLLAQETMSTAIFNFKSAIENRQPDPDRSSRIVSHLELLEEQMKTIDKGPLLYADRNDGPKNNKVQHAFVGFELTSMSDNQLSEYLDDYNVIMGLVPMSIEENRGIIVNHKQSAAMRSFSLVASRRMYNRRPLWDQIREGIDYKLKESDGQIMRADIIKDFNGYSLVKCSKVETITQERSTLPFHTNGGDIEVVVPKLQWAAGDLLPTVQEKTFKVSKKLYSKLCNRMLNPETTLEQLMNYGRTAFFANYYTNATQGKVYQETTAELEAAVITAYWTMKKKQVGMKQVLGGLENTTEDNVIGMIKKGLPFALKKALAEITEALGLSDMMSYILTDTKFADNHELLSKTLMSLLKYREASKPKTRVMNRILRISSGPEMGLRVDTQKTGLTTPGKHIAHKLFGTRTYPGRGNKMQRTKPNEPTILMITAGTLGDILPYVTLAKILLQKGVHVHFICYELYVRHIEKHDNLTIYPVAGDGAEIIRLIKTAQSQGVTAIRQANEKVAAIDKTMITAVQKLTIQYDLIMEPWWLKAGYIYSLQTAIPYALCNAVPLHAGRGWPHPRSGGRWDEELQTRSYNAYTDATFSFYLNEMTKSGQIWFPSHEMPSSYEEPMFVLIPPAIYGAHKRHPGVKVLGSLKTSQDLPEPVLTDDPASTVIVTMGSMPKLKRVDNLISFLKELNNQGFMLHLAKNAWSHPDLSERLEEEKTLTWSKVGTIDFDKLNGKYCAMVGAGGAGATLCAIRNRIPKFIFPQFGDMGFWMRYVKINGFGDHVDELVGKKVDLKEMITEMTNNLQTSELVEEITQQHNNEGLVISGIIEMHDQGHLQIGRVVEKLRDETDIESSPSESDDGDEHQDDRADDSGEQEAAKESDDSQAHKHREASQKDSKHTEHDSVTRREKKSKGRLDMLEKTKHFKTNKASTMKSTGHSMRRKPAHKPPNRPSRKQGKESKRLQSDHERGQWRDAYSNLNINDQGLLDFKSVTTAITGLDVRNMQDKPDSSKTIYRNYRIPIGVHEGLLESHIVEFNPDSTSGCVEACLRHQIEVIDKSKLDMQVAQMQLLPFMTYDQLIAAAFSVGYNIMIARDDRIVDIYRMHEEDNWIVVSLKQLEMMTHCRLLRRADLEDFRLQNAVPATEETNVTTHSCGVYKNCLTVTSNLITGCEGHIHTSRTPMEFISSVNKVRNLKELGNEMNRTVSDLQTILTKSNIRAKVMRQVDKVRYLQLVKDANGWFDVNGSLSPNRLCLLQTNRGWLNAPVMGTRLGFMIAADTMGLEATGIVIDNGSMKQSAKMTTKPSKLLTVGCTYLNKATQQYARNTGQSTLGCRVADMNSMQLVIGDYDNREHHKYDEGDIVKKYHEETGRKIIFLGSEMKKEDFDQMLERKIPRVVYRMGSVAAELEFDESVSLAIHSAKMFTDSTQVKQELRGNTLTITNWGMLQASKKTSINMACNDLLVKEGQKLVPRVKLKEAGLKYVEQGTFNVERDDFRKAFTEADDYMSVKDYWMAIMKKMKYDGEKNLTFSVVTRPLKERKQGTAIDQLRTLGIAVLADGLTFITQRGWVMLRVHLEQGAATNPEDVIDVKVTKQSDWWRLEQNLEPQIDVAEATNKLSVEALMDMRLTTIKEVTNVTMEDSPVTPLELSVIDEYSAQAGWLKMTDISELEITSSCMDFWATNDLSDYLERKLPINRIKFTSSETHGKLITILKHSMTPYPEVAKPVLTKLTNAVFNAATQRLGSAITLRKEAKEPSVILQGFKLAYLRKDAGEFLKRFQEDSLTFDSKATAEWLSNRKDGKKLLKEVQQLLAEGFEVNRLTQVNVHAKLESLVKEDISSNPKTTTARLIVWHAKKITALFAPIFIKAKTRLKMILSDKFIYADGMTPKELSEDAGTVKGVNGFFMNDMSKFDRQTDEDNIDAEMAIYQLLGVSDQVLKCWRVVHKLWSMRDRHMSSQFNGMRLTGQATTALGNAIVNLIVHTDLILQNKGRVKKMYIMGDDMVALVNKEVDASHYNKHMKAWYNMSCKPMFNKSVGQFCSMFVYKNEHGTCEFGPDMVRLRRRYELTNGVRTDVEPIKDLRAQSYCCFLGESPENRELANKFNPQLKLPRWYNYKNLRKAVADYYNITVEEVDNEVLLLRRMISENKVYEHKFYGFSTLGPNDK